MPVYVFCIAVLEHGRQAWAMVNSPLTDEIALGIPFLESVGNVVSIKNLIKNPTSSLL